MSQWFKELARIEDPGLEHLGQFLEELELLLKTILDDDELLQRLCRNDSDLCDSARNSFEKDVQRGFREMRNKLMQSPVALEASDNGFVDRLRDHGLIGVSARFKFSAVARISRSWRRHKGHLTIGTGFRRVMESVDTILDSIVSVLGVGGATKEFKDILMALAPNSAGD